MKAAPAPSLEEDQDDRDLREMQAELVAAERSTWQPRVVAKAFRAEPPEHPFVFRMQTWIELSAVQSPFLHERLPAPEEWEQQFRAAFAAFGLDAATLEESTGEELVLIGKKIVRAIHQGFSTDIKLIRPDGRPAGRAAHGMGSWLPILACLKGQLYFDLDSALALPVAQAFALIAAHRINEGWNPEVETYEKMDIEEAAP